MSGPPSIANVSYKIAGDPAVHHFIGLININLAIVNFLPIPILTAAHGVVVYEKVRGKPPDKLVEGPVRGPRNDSVSDGVCDLSGCATVVVLTIHRPPLAA